MSTGGNVPSQGVVVQEATTQKKRGARGELGEGTAGSRLKSEWRKCGSKLSLRSWAREEVKRNGHPDAKDWLLSKGAGTPEQRSARKARLKERQSANRTAKLARKGKGKQQKKAA